MNTLNPQIKIHWSKKDRREYHHKSAVIRKRFEKIAVLPGELIEVARMYAKNIAPIDTATLINSIKTRTPEKNSSELYIDENILRSNPKLKKSNKGFNYALWMHNTGGQMGNRQVIKTGDPNFMLTTMEYMRKLFGYKVKAFLKSR